MFSVTFRYLSGCAVAVHLNAAPLAVDSYEPGTPLPTSEAAGRITVPDGFRVTLFAGEPDVVQPIAMATDGRARLWVVECFSYPSWQRSGEGRDRVLVLEDRDGDGRFDSRKVLADSKVGKPGTPDAERVVINCGVW